jgi:hypothetical protein
LSSPVRRRLRIVSKHLPPCSQPLVHNTWVVVVAILEMSLATSSRAPLHSSVPIARVSELDGASCQARLHDPGTLAGPFTRSPRRVLPMSAVHNLSKNEYPYSCALPAPQQKPLHWWTAPSTGPVRFGPNQHSHAGVLFLACACAQSEPLTSRRLTQFPFPLSPGDGH